VTSWLATGLKIEEAQYVMQISSHHCPADIFGRLILANEVRQLSRYATPTQMLDIAKKRERLQSRIDSFHSKASSYFVDLEYDELDDGWVTVDDADDLDDPEGSRPEPLAQAIETDTLEPEKVPIILPSMIGLQRCLDANMEDIVEKEITLRQGQVNDALQGLRMAIGKKSFLFRTKLRTAKSKVEKLRSWDDIGTVTGSVQHQARIYRKARLALLRLGTSDEIMKKYQVLKPEDLKSCTAIVDPNARGQRNAKLAWFWSLDVSGDSLDNELMLECECQCCHNALTISFTTFQFTG
jgi:hypothetical protein